MEFTNRECPMFNTIKCGACGEVGHKRTDRECPMVNTIKEVKRGPGRPRRKVGPVVHCNYLQKRPLKIDRMRTDPVVTMSTVLEEILNEVRDLPNTEPFQHPVKEKHVPGYYRIVKNPIDLQTMREKLRTSKYVSRKVFLDDLNLIFANSSLYNGPQSVLTQTAKSMLDMCIQKLAEKEEKLVKLEKAINPFLDENDIVGFTFILGNITERLRAIPVSWPFLKPVSKKFVKNYFDIIENPICIMDIEEKIKKKKYHSQHQFLEDVSRIHSNSVRYNGPESNLTAMAKEICKTCKQLLLEHETDLSKLEANMQAVRQVALDAVETDSNIKGTSYGNRVHDDHSGIRDT
jgi:transcription initiation factor TFIID subunit 1